MPESMTWIAVLTLGMAIVFLAVVVMGLRRDLRERARRDDAQALRDEADEQQVAALLARRRDPEPVVEEQPRRLWIVPAVTALAGALPALGWLRSHSGAIGGTVAGATVVTVLFIAGSSTSDTHRAELPGPPVIVAPTTTTRAPSSTSQLPPATTTTTTAPTAPPVVETVDFVPTMTTVVPSSTTTTAPTGSTTVPPSSMTTVPSPTMRPCLLRVQLLDSADLCVST